MRGDALAVDGAPHELISIRAPHMRGDASRSSSALVRADFNPRPSYEGRLALGEHSACVAVISIRAPHMRGDASLGYRLVGTKISIRAPHMRGDAYRALVQGARDDFNPRPSYEGRRCVMEAYLWWAQFQSAPLI